MRLIPSNRSNSSDRRDRVPDNIESNIVSVAQNTSSAADELTTAHEYQRKAGRRMACLLVILLVVIAVILLAVSDGWGETYLLM